MVPNLVQDTAHTLSSSRVVIALGILFLSGKRCFISTPIRISPISHYDTSSFISANSEKLRFTRMLVLLNVIDFHEVRLIH